MNGTVTLRGRLLGTLRKIGHDLDPVFFLPVTHFPYRMPIRLRRPLLLPSRALRNESTSFNIW